eukprot:11378501-Ditylum_brightwellii.AAC.1
MPCTGITICPAIKESSLRHQRSGYHLQQCNKGTLQPAQPFSATSEGAPTYKAYKYHATSEGGYH